MSAKTLLLSALAAAAISVPAAAMSHDTGYDHGYSSENSYGDRDQHDGDRQHDRSGERSRPIDGYRGEGAWGGRVRYRAERYQNYQTGWGYQRRQHWGESQRDEHENHASEYGYGAY